MKRRRLLGALAGGTAATSGCISSVDTPSFDEGGDRPPLAREDLVSDGETGTRESTIPHVPLLSVSTATGERERVGPRVVDPAVSEDDTTTAREETTTGTERTSTTANATTTGAVTAGTTTAPGPDREFDEPGLYVTDDFWRYRTHVHRYAFDEVTTTVFPVEPSAETAVKVVVAAYVYPRGTLIATAESDAFRLSSDAQQVTIPVDLSPAPEDVPMQYVAAVVPESVDQGDISVEELYALMETDPFVRVGDGIERTDPESKLQADSGAAFERQPVEGGYVQTLRGRTNGRSWEVSFLAFQSAYEAAASRSRGRARAEYVSFELMEGAGNHLGRFLYDAAENNGFTSEFERIQFALGFVQRLPYVPDDVTSGYDDYTQFIMETLTMLSGDCEDSSILFASIMESRPFNYDAVLLEPPGHMAAGLLVRDDFDGFSYIYDGRQYSYVETTTEGWGIGQIPDRFRDAKAQVYDV